MPTHMKHLITESLKENSIKLDEAKIAILGYAFLENSDDTRNTPAKPLYNSLVKECREVIVHDTHVKEEEGINLTGNLKNAVQGKDCIALVTRHQKYLSLDLDWLSDQMNTKIIVDGRNVFNPETAREHGFTFRGVGIGK
jgi:UDP-N-acetyl-D-mannosaminuronic acid dehydrogenase